ncbi:septum formation protein Maf [bacterium]|nr:septum formation protein Maf [bacterium]
MIPKTESFPRLYLASQSPRRKEILDNLGVAYTSFCSPYVEGNEDFSHLSPIEQASKLAALKAFHGAKTLHEGIVIGADTIVVYENSIFGKPKDRDDACRMLEILSGKTHKVITGIAVVDVERLTTVSDAEVTKVSFRGLSEREIKIYLQTKEPYDKAGAYAIQGFASLFIERIEGCYYNVVGFPVIRFGKVLKEIGLNLIDYISLEKAQ